MSGMDMMLANLIGIKPQEIRAAVEQTMNAISAAAKDIEEIKNRLTAMEVKLNSEDYINVRRELISDYRNSEQFNGNNGTAS